MHHIQNVYEHITTAELYLMSASRERLDDDKGFRRALLATQGAQAQALISIAKLLARRDRDAIPPRKIDASPITGESEYFTLKGGV